MITVYNNNRTQEIIKELTQNIKVREEGYLIIAGDLNARTGEKGSTIGGGIKEGRKSKHKIKIWRKI